MMGLLSDYSQTYLLCFFVLTTVLFSIPIFFVPLTWARLLKWNIPADTDLTVYFGRCLGSFALVTAALSYRAATTGQGQSVVFDLLAGFSALMVGLHIYGAVKKIQPLIETLEIGFWAAIFVATLLFYPLV